MKHIEERNTHTYNYVLERLKPYLKTRNGITDLVCPDNVLVDMSYEELFELLTDYSYIKMYDKNKNSIYLFSLLGLISNAFMMKNNKIEVAEVLANLPKSNFHDYLIMPIDIYGSFLLNTPDLKNFVLEKAQNLIVFYYMTVLEKSFLIKHINEKTHLPNYPIELMKVHLNRMHEIEKETKTAFSNTQNIDKKQLCLAFITDKNFIESVIRQTFEDSPLRIQAEFQLRHLK